MSIWNYKLQIRDTRHYDLQPVAEHMKEADKQEVWYSNNLTPLAALKKGYVNSTACYTILNTDVEPIAIFGAGSERNKRHTGCVWLLSTPELNMNKEFLRRSVETLATLEEGYACTGNWVSVENTESLRWLRWLGYLEMSYRKEFGAEQKPFVYMLKLNEDYFREDAVDV